MGNKHSSGAPEKQDSEVDVAILKQAEALGWTREEAEHYGRVCNTWIEAGMDTFETQFSGMRYVSRHSVWPNLCELRLTRWLDMAGWRPGSRFASTVAISVCAACQV